VEWRKCLQWDRAHLQSQAYYIQNYIYSRFKENQIDQQLELIFGLHSTFFCGRWKKKKKLVYDEVIYFSKKNLFKKEIGFILVKNYFLVNFYPNLK